MTAKTPPSAFAREIDMYAPLLELFSHPGLAFAEVPFFGKRIDLVFCTPSLLSLYAIETKLRDWRSAFKQAAVNQLAAQKSYIAVPSGLANRLARTELDLFRKYDVGLVSVDQSPEVLIVPKRNGCFSLPHYQVLKSTLRGAQGKKPKRIGVAANAIASRTEPLVVLQTRPN